MIDAYQTEGGVDTSTSTNYIYDSTNKDYHPGTGATGGTITNYTSSGTKYTSHTFLADGTLVTLNAASIDYLLVGGGGSAGQGYYQGGGGGGGVRNANGYSLPAGSYGVVVGGGGGPTAGDPGGNTTFNSIIAAGGAGASAGNPHNPGVSGGSGSGGDTTQPGGAGNTPSTSPSQGNPGGAGGSNGAGGGGGGIGATGGAGGSSEDGGDGGTGTAFALDGTSYYYAGGGGGAGGNAADAASNGIGGDGGQGGGGGGAAAKAPNKGSAGTGGRNTASPAGDHHPYAGGNGGANTGGGAGGGSGPGGQAAGGSGIAIMRYLEGAEGSGNMTLESNTQTAQASPTEGRLMLYEQDTDSITPGTDIKGYVSRDGGTTWSGAVGLVDDGFLNVVQGNDNYTKLLLHMDGANDGTTFTDDSASAHTVTAVANAVTKTAEKKFGTASAYFDDNSSWLTVPDSDDWTMGSENFTIDCWVKPSVTDTHFPILGQWTSDTNYWRVIGNHIGGGVHRWSYQVNIGSGSQITITDTGNITTSWAHLAVVRNGNVQTLYVNGTSVGTPGAYTGSIDDVASLLYIGAVVQGSGMVDALGYIDELRISKGIARWTAAFTPPTSPYATNTRLLSGSVDISGQPAGTDMKYKVETLNNKNLKLHGASLLWA